VLLPELGDPLLVLLQMIMKLMKVMLWAVLQREGSATMMYLLRLARMMQRMLLTLLLLMWILRLEWP